MPPLCLPFSAYSAPLAGHIPDDDLLALANDDVGFWMRLAAPSLAGIAEQKRAMKHVRRKACDLDLRPHLRRPPLRMRRLSETTRTGCGGAQCAMSPIRGQGHFWLADGEHTCPLSESSSSSSATVVAPQPPSSCACPRAPFLAPIPLPSPEPSSHLLSRFSTPSSVSALEHVDKPVDPFDSPFFPLSEDAHLRATPSTCLGSSPSSSPLRDYTLSSPGASAYQLPHPLPLPAHLDAIFGAPLPSPLPAASAAPLSPRAEGALARCVREGERAAERPEREMLEEELRTEVRGRMPLRVERWVEDQRGRGVRRRA
ncbi:hypothetical protein JCM10213_003275 [Rhodosporidiobolus nylandii]